MDNFKNINDSHGHDHGDEVLKVVSKRIIETLRSFDVAGRIGGDEFIILIRGSEKEYLNFLNTIVDRLITEINIPIVFKEQVHCVGVSIGIALIPKDGEIIDELLKHADFAMYEAKKAGKNCAVFHKKLI